MADARDMRTRTPKTARVTPTASTVTDLYSPGTGKDAYFDAILIHNDNAAQSVNARVMFALTATADNRNQRVWDVQIPANDTFAAKVGPDPSGTDTFRCWADTANVNFFLAVLEGPL